MHGMHGKCCSLVVWDGKYRRKAARMMERDGATLMAVEEMTVEKVKEEGGLLRKPSMERRSGMEVWRRENARGAQECIEGQTERSDFWGGEC